MKTINRVRAKHYVKTNPGVQAMQPVKTIGHERASKAVKTKLYVRKTETERKNDARQRGQTTGPKTEKEAATVAIIPVVV